MLPPCDGIRRKTAKSKLFDAALPSLIENDAQYPPNDQCAHRIYILDITAIIRSLVKVPNTFKDVALRLLSDIPMQYNIVYVACDTYKDRSIWAMATSLLLEVQMCVYQLILRSFSAMETTRSIFLR